ncbi:hypothetical protein F2Q69_00019583 [Brassica cretica]|uniref:Uncharacterized protein n=1 Tax=Brassica cretica TaxID=69181 RepID=A0A8S9QCS5_BRACR|nr:hypothetical protein F2Q69_00019583 [Brassica cretica]
MHNEMTKRPLSRNEFEQTEGAQRPPVVAPRGRSRLRERPGGVAARLRERPRCVAPVTSLWVMEMRATSLCRSGQVALKGCHSDFTVSLR